MKLFVFIFIMHILFCWKNQKNILQKEIKDWTFKAYSLTKEISSSFLLIASLKMTWAWSKRLWIKEIKDWTFEAYSLTKEISSWFLLIASLKMSWAWSYVWFWNFTREGLFFATYLTQTGKITVTSPKSVKGNKWGQFWLAQS